MPASRSARITSKFFWIAPKGVAGSIESALDLSSSDSKILCHQKINLFRQIILLVFKAVKRSKNVLIVLLGRGDFLVEDDRVNRRSARSNTTAVQSFNPSEVASVTFLMIHGVSSSMDGALVY